jgi:predicted nicotinamide N-methyase
MAERLLPVETEDRALRAGRELLQGGRGRMAVRSSRLDADAEAQVPAAAP